VPSVEHRIAGRPEVQIEDLVDLRPQEPEEPLLSKRLSSHLVSSDLVAPLHCPEEVVHRLEAHRLLRVRDDDLPCVARAWGLASARQGGILGVVNGCLNSLVTVFVPRLAMQTWYVSAARRSLENSNRMSPS
jgi:hypothetical protein